MDRDTIEMILGLTMDKKKMKAIGFGRQGLEFGRSRQAYSNIISMVESLDDGIYIFLYVLPLLSKDGSENLVTQGVEVPLSAAQGGTVYAQVYEAEGFYLVVSGLG